jgi:hypothetical protein
MAFNLNNTSGGGSELRAVLATLSVSTELNINATAGGGQALRDVEIELSDGTILYPFHPWIEASETSDTVLSVFGQWWDGDAGGGSSVSIPIAMRHYLQMMGAG